MTTRNSPASSSAEASNTRALSISECWSLLRQGALGRLAVVVDAEPDLFPINYVVDRGTLVFRTDTGRKLAGAAAGPVAFEVDGLDASDGTRWSVVVRGRAKEILDKDEVIEALSLPLAPLQSGRKPRFMRLVPHSTTGRRLQVSTDAGGRRLESPPGSRDFRL